MTMEERAVSIKETLGKTALAQCFDKITNITAF